MADRDDDVTVVILAGGEATRLPGKLALEAGDVPLLVRVYRNVSPRRRTLLSCQATLPPEIDALLDAPAVIDRWSGRGPLAGLLTTMSVATTRWVFACAGDAPFVDAAFVDRLAALRAPGDEAVVPRSLRGDRRGIEPLAALYDRLAFLRAGLPVLRAGNGALRLVIEALRTRYVDVAEDMIFANINTPADYAAFRGAAS